MLRKALGGARNLMGDSSEDEDELDASPMSAPLAPAPARRVAPHELGAHEVSFSSPPPAVPNPMGPITPASEWLDLLGIAGADLGEVVPSGVSEECLGRLVSARPETCLGVWAPSPRGRAAVCAIAAAYDADGFEDALAVAALALCLAAPDGSRARRAVLGADVASGGEDEGDAAQATSEALAMLRAATRRLKRDDAFGERCLAACAGTLLPRVAPRAWQGRPDAGAFVL